MPGNIWLIPLRGAATDAALAVRLVIREDFNKGLRNSEKQRREEIYDRLSLLV
jgi:hypothetical protein